MYGNWLVTPVNAASPLLNMSRDRLLIAISISAAGRVQARKARGKKV